MLTRHHQNSSNPPRHLRKIQYLLRRQRPSQNIALAVGQPFLEDLVATELCSPKLRWGRCARRRGCSYIRPTSFSPSGRVLSSPSAARSVRGVFALDNAALARHYSVACSVVTPTCGECEIIGGHIATIGGSGHGDSSDFRAQRALSNARHWRFGVEQTGQFAASRR